MPHNVIRKDERIVCVIPGIRRYFNKHKEHESGALIVKMPQFRHVSILLECDQVRAIRPKCKESHWLSNVNQLSCVMETSRCIMRALKHSSITLHRGCPLLPLLFDGLHHYPYSVFLCVQTGGTVNMTVLGFMFPGPECSRKKGGFCFGLELLRLICNGLPICLILAEIRLKTDEWWQVPKSK